MNIPGFTAQASLGHHGHDHGRAAPRTDTAGVVTPAAACCSACAKWCGIAPNGPFCQGCRRHGCLINC